MAMEEITREALRDKLGGLMGKEYAGKLMGYLPGEEPASKADLNDVRQDVSGLRQDLSRLRESMNERFNHVEQLFDHKLEGMEGRLRAEFHKELSSIGMRFGDQIAAQTRAMLQWVSVMVLTVAALAFGAARLA